MASFARREEETRSDLKVCLARRGIDHQLRERRQRDVAFRERERVGSLQGTHVDVESAGVVVGVTRAVVGHDAHLRVPVEPRETERGVDNQIRSIGALARMGISVVACYGGGSFGVDVFEIVCQQHVEAVGGVGYGAETEESVATGVDIDVFEAYG